MYSFRLSKEELPIIATIIESTSIGLFTSKMKRYLKSVIDSTTLTNNEFPILIDYWPAIYLLSTLYQSEVSGPSASLMYKLEDALGSEDVRPEHIISTDTAPYK